MGACTDLVPVLIDLDVGAFRLQFLNAFETTLMDGWGTDGPRTGHGLFSGLKESLRTLFLQRRMR
jgi:hypothetical protein